MRRLLLLGLALLATACINDVAGLGPASDPATESFASSLNVNVATMTKTPDGLYYRDIINGTGPLLVKDTTVQVTYSGYLADGTLFDSGTGVSFQTNALVPGFREGLMGMRVGGRRQLVIRSSLGYGETGSPPNVPRQATLVFVVDLLAIQ
ncbi:MAG: FKBP-type peptidyl-prolyl cis-trans isomerase [Gemmatimonadota bacterium]|nr:FKBP-type peptidyl-prolyl cis-trans isomerase [Gemmatimonadota bacterium]MDE3171986.1 FKBP-type peptidyl-prolyl cis-trans isomerase [Gemmatimonadota bacterium]MDE3215547.1 FKBP-type peptidyl-prolyl cis-trans isomerase [Gemmatimonadota bacterium]